MEGPIANGGNLLDTNALQHKELVSRISIDDGKKSSDSQRLGAFGSWKSISSNNLQSVACFAGRVTVRLLARDLSSRIMCSEDQVGVVFFVPRPVTTVRRT